MRPLVGYTKKYAVCKLHAFCKQPDTFRLRYSVPQLSRFFANTYMYLPHAASCGTQLLLYPTAIGSEPQDPTLNSSAHWRRVMQGHAGVSF